jgi:hypothetical protein
MQPDSKPSRVHIAVGRLSLEEAAVFLASALLTSHGIRRDTLAIINIKNTYIIIPGWSVRHLRPDLDTARGWIRAVLRGKPLGARVSMAPPSYPSGCCLRVVASASLRYRCTCSARPKGTATILYYTGADKDGEPSPRPSSCEGCPEFAGELALPTPLSLAPAIINTELDRIRVGLPPLLLCCR